jgi:hypothetical protein
MRLASASSPSSAVIVVTFRPGTTLKRGTRFRISSLAGKTDQLADGRQKSPFDQQF